MRHRDIWGIGFVAAATAAIVLYRYVYIEPRFWGAACVAARPPLACLPRAALLWLQHFYLWGAAALLLGAWAFFARGGFAVQLAAIVIGIAAVENYNATWGALGAALGAWTWLSRSSGGAAKISAQAFQSSD